VKNRTIKFIDGTDIIEVRYAGEIPYSYRVETLDELERMLPADGLNRLLVNYTSAWPATAPEPRALAAFAEKIGRVAFTRGARIALVNAPLDVESQTAEASTPAGFLFRQFHDRDLAIAWLREDRDAAAP
jgi:hypothetical protein